MKQIKEAKLSYWAHHLTTIISVTLVLLLMGIIALIWIGADSETRRLKEKVELNVIMADTVPDKITMELAAEISRQPYAVNVHVITRQEALDNWTRDTGENLEEIFGVNPLSEEISFGIKAEHANASGIEAIEKTLSAKPGVESVAVPDARMLESMNENISRLTLLLSVIGVIMLLISFGLINNTVHLTIYSRRFQIHTMQLVGATNGFIRRPVILENMLAGILAGIFSAILLAAGVLAVRESDTAGVVRFITWEAFAPVAAGLIAAGALLCMLTAWCSANIYLRKSYDQLFK